MMLYANRCISLVACLFLAHFFLFSKASAQSQEVLFTTIQSGQDSLIGEQTTRYNKLSILTQDIVDIYVIQIGDLALLQQNGIVNILLPDGECDMIRYKMKNVSYNSSSDYEWYGEVDRSDTSEWRSGSFMVIAQNGAKFGYLTIDVTNHQKCTTSLHQKCTTWQIKISQCC